MFQGDFNLEHAVPVEASDNADVLFELGLLYASGRSVGLDLVSAHKWFNLAAMKGIDEARRWRAQLSGEMSANQIAEAQRQARDRGGAELAVEAQSAAELQRLHRGPGPVHEESGLDPRPMLGLGDEAARVGLGKHTLHRRAAQHRRRRQQHASLTQQRLQRWFPHPQRAKCGCV